MSYDEGLTTHIIPESYAGNGNIAGEVIEMGLRWGHANYIRAIKGIP